MDEVTQWTRAAAHETKHELAAMLDVLGADEDLLVRALGPRRPVKRLGFPPPGPTYWEEHTNGQFPRASWCTECERPAAINYRYKCPNHTKRKDTQ
jgi:hypothetical protein